MVQHRKVGALCQSELGTCQVPLHDNHVNDGLGTCVLCKRSAPPIRNPDTPLLKTTVSFSPTCVFENKSSLNPGTNPLCIVFAEVNGEVSGLVLQRPPAALNVIRLRPDLAVQGRRSGD